jgi:hypothetical protein
MKIMPREELEDIPRREEKSGEVHENSGNKKALVWLV